MDVDERLDTILQECRWVTDPGTALRLIPALGVDAPAFVPLPMRDGQVRPSVPVVCVPMVADAVVRTVVAAVQGQAAGLEDADAETVAADPLCAACAEMFSQCSHPGLRAQAVPALVVAWCAWEVLAGRGTSLPEQPATRRRTRSTPSLRYALKTPTSGRGDGVVQSIQRSTAGAQRNTRPLER